MRYYMIPVLLVVLVSMVSAQDAPVAEVYVYGNDLGFVTINDLATDGQVITLKGVQIWPKQPQKSVPVPVASFEERQKSSLMQSVIDRQIELQRHGNSNAQILPALIDLLIKNSLVKSAVAMGDNCIEITWVGESTSEYFEIVPTGNRPTWDERIRQEYEILQMVIERGCIIIVGTECRMIVPVSAADRSQQDRVRAEIEAAKTGTWSGGLLQASLADEFRHPRELPVRQED